MLIYMSFFLLNAFCLIATCNNYTTKVLKRQLTNVEDMLKRDELYLAQLTNISWEGRISTV